MNYARDTSDPFVASLDELPPSDFDTQHPSKSSSHIKAFQVPGDPASCWERVTRDADMLGFSCTAAPGRKAHIQIGEWRLLVEIAPLDQCVIGNRWLQAIEFTDQSSCVVIVTSEHELSGELGEAISAFLQSISGFVSREVETIIDSLPLLKAISNDRHDFSNMALIWRDHFLEENIALLEAMIRCGLRPENIYALDKGDATRNRTRITCYFRERKMHVAMFDNGKNEEECEASAHTVRHSLVEFAQVKKAQGLNVAVVDDGATLWKIFDAHQHLISFALELTLPGLRRLKTVRLNVPVLDLASTRLKREIGYREIAKSCFQRVLELLNFEKFPGRAVALLGYGTAGRFLARQLASIGCHVCIVETDRTTLIAALEDGYRGYESVSALLTEVDPMLLIGASGEVSMSAADLQNLRNGTYVTGIATRDLNCFEVLDARSSADVPGYGTVFELWDGRRIIRLGNGRSINLFESEAIANKGYDLFKAAIFVATSFMSQNFATVRPGVHLTLAEEVLEASQILDRYFDLYFRRPQPQGFRCNGRSAGSPLYSPMPKLTP